MSDPYKVLGISRDATDDEVKQAYRKLSRKYHPDANINNPNKDKAEEMFKPMVVQVTATTVVVIPAILLMICLVVLEASAVLTVGRDSPVSITVRMLPITLLLLTTSTIGVFRKL